jgi:hypothetical protein
MKGFEEDDVVEVGAAHPGALETEADGALGEAEVVFDRLKRSSSAAATSIPSRSSAAAASWK